MNAIYFDCFAGIAGDMILGAFLDLGLPRDYLESELRKLPFGSFRLRVEEVERGGIRGKQVTLDESGEDRQHRTFRDISEGISQSGLTPGVTDLSLRFFRRLAEAESRLHGTSPDEVTFHEVGGIHSIIDLVGAAVSLDYFRPDSILASELPLGRGFIDAAHSRLPLPAPATLEILKGVPTVPHPAPEETVTPTGATVIREISQGFGGYPPMQVQEIGYGAGTRESRAGIPNLLRVVSGQLQGNWQVDSVCRIETTLDDMNPEMIPGLRRELEDAGALEVLCFPVQAKKDRPAVVVHALCRESDRERLAHAFFLGSSTSGIRFHRMERYLLARDQKIVTTPWGEVRVKVIEGKGPDGSWIHPEYEDLRMIAERDKIPLIQAEKMVKEYLIRNRE